MQLVKGLFALAAVFGLTAVVVADDKKKDDVPSVKDIMVKAHKGNMAILSKLKTQLGNAKPDWETIQGETKELLELAEALGKNEVKKGGKESWETLTKSYVNNAKTLNEAAEKKEKTKASMAQGKLGSSCKMCHDKHR